jgi:glyceraldehyde 3-phosphate dehydrogenase
VWWSKAAERGRGAEYRHNQQLFDPAVVHPHRYLFSRSCTTNCLAPVVKVTKTSASATVDHHIHDLTNTYILDQPSHKDLVPRPGQWY